MQQLETRAAAVSFIIRMRDMGSSADMRGEVEHLGTGERRIFRDATSLIQLLEDWRREK